MRLVVLIGFMGAGKTTVGRALARRLRWRFFDLDDAIEKRKRQTIAQIFASSGGTGFRRAEAAALRGLFREKTGGGLGFRLGGGAVVQKQKRARLERAGAPPVLLEAPLEELRRRCRNERKVRPLAQQEAGFAELFAARRADYERAQFRVQTLGKPVARVAAELEKLLQAVTQAEVEG